MKKKSTQQKESTIHQIIFLVILAGLVILIGGSTASATLVFENGDELRMFQGPVVEGMTILDALNASVMAGHIKFKFAMEENRTKILEINGHGKINDADLDFYLNSEKIDDEMIGQISVEPKDKILVKVVSK